MRKILRRFITWLYTRYVIVPEFQEKLKEIAETDGIVLQMLDEGYEIEFEPDPEFECQCQEKLH